MSKRKAESDPCDPYKTKKTNNNNENHVNNPQLPLVMYVRATRRHRKSVYAQQIRQGCDLFFMCLWNFVVNENK